MGFRKKDQQTLKNCFLKQEDRETLEKSCGTQLRCPDEGLHCDPLSGNGRGESNKFPGQDKPGKAEGKEEE